MYAEHVRDYLDDARRRRGLSDNTLRAYQADLAHFTAYLGGVRRALKARIKAYPAHLSDVCDLSARSARRRVVAVNGFLDWLKTARGVKAPARPEAPSLRRVANVLPRTAPRALLPRLSHMPAGPVAAPGPMVAEPADGAALVFPLMLATGLRVGETCALRPCDFDVWSGALRVRGKGARERTVFVVNARLAGALARHAEARARLEGPGCALFLNAAGRPLTPANVRLRLRRLAEAAGAGRVTPHMLRHTSATLHLERGVDIRFVQRLLGHASIATTEIYAHVADEALKEAMKKGDLLG